MSRIRSVHPGLFTDEAFMTASLAARLLFIGIWTEARDDGVFEWKPLTLKAKLFPADNLDVRDLLTELEGLGFIRPFDSGGSSYGVVRNFGRFQRPKKPNPSGLLPPEFRTYAALSQPGSKLLPNRWGTGDASSDDSSEPVGKEWGKSPANGDGDGVDNPSSMIPQSRARARARTSSKNSQNGPAQPATGYALEHGCVKLNEADFEKWKRAYPHVGVAGELIAAEPWLSRQSNWYTAASGLLAKRERQAASKLKRPPPVMVRDPSGEMVEHYQRDPLGNFIESEDEA